MPNRDGTGPLGIGAMTGRGLGLCFTNNVRPFYCRNGYKRGYRFIANQNPVQNQKDLLKLQRDYLQKELENIDKQIESL